MPALRRPHVLAHPARRTIVEHLALADVEDPGHLADVLWVRHRLAQSSASKHLRRLAEARVIVGVAVLGGLRYRLRRDVLAALAEWASAVATDVPPGHRGPSDFDWTTLALVDADRTSGDGPDAGSGPAPGAPDAARTTGWDH